MCDSSKTTTFSSNSTCVILNRDLTASCIVSPDLPPWKDKLNHTVSPRAQQQASHAKPTTFTSTVLGRGAPHLFVFIRSKPHGKRRVNDHTHPRTSQTMPGPRPKHNEAATDEAETLGGCFESSIMRTGVVVALKIARIKKVRGSGLPCEMRHSLTHSLFEVSAGETRRTLSVLSRIQQQ